MKTKILVDKQIYDNHIMELIREYNDLLDLLSAARRWVDNGLRVCSRIRGVPKDSKERGMALENELGRDLSRLSLKYGLQVSFGEYQIADAILKLKNGMMLRIEAKYVGKV